MDRCLGDKEQGVSESISVNQRGVLDEAKDGTEGNSKFPLWSPGWMPQVCEIGDTGDT